jgi:inositol-phosphate transport system permease protein
LTVAATNAPSSNFRIWPVVLALGLVSAPLVLMYVYLFVDTVTNTTPGSLIPSSFTLEHWDFLWRTRPGKASVWTAALNTLIFATSTTTIVLLVSSTAGYVLSRLNVPGRAFFLAGVMVLHAFPSVTLIIAIFIVLQMVGLYNSLIGVILVKAALELPLGIWLMKGFYDTVPWEIEMAGIADGASRFTVWRRLVLPQVAPAFAALGLFAFLSGWSEYILPQVLTPGNNVQVMSVYLASLISDDNNFDLNLFKAVGVFYILPVVILFAFFQKHLMNIYGGGSKG